MEAVKTLFGGGAGREAQRMARQTQELANLREAQVRRREAESSGAAAASAARPRIAQLSSTGYSGLRNRLGGPRA